MLNLVRKHADSWLIKTILWTIVMAFIGTIFYSWGMGGASKLTGGVIATVEGAKIDFNEYNKTFNNLVEFYREQFKNQFSNEMIRKLDLKTVALDVLIQKKLLLMEAKKQNIKASDDEVSARIKGFPAFQRDQKFNSDAYKNFLKNKRLTPYEFEEGQRESIILEKMENLIRESVKTTQTEMIEAFKKEENKIKLEYISFAEDHFKVPSLSVSKEEKNAYFEKNKLKFEVPENIKVEYVKLTPKSYEADIEAKEEEIQEYYNAKIADFRDEARYKANHILIRPELLKLDENTPPEEKKKKLSAADDSAKAKAGDILKKIREGASFEEMAKQHSDDKVSGARGGDLGEFPRGAMVQEFEAALNKLKAGEVSEPILTPFGYHLIKLVDKKSERVKPLSEVKDSLVVILKENKARQQIRRIAKLIHKNAKDNGDLASAAKEQKLATKTTGFFSADSHNLPEIGTAPEFFNLAFSLKDNVLGSPLNTAEASYLLKLVERKPAYIPELPEIEDKIASALIQEKNKALTSQKYKEFEKLVAESKDLEKVAKENNFEIKRTALFGIEDSIPGIGNNVALKESAFKLNLGEGAGILARNGWYLFKVTDFQAAKEPTEAQATAVYARLKKEKGDAAFQAWLKEMRAKADIMIDKTLL
ncbi:MAG: hypothetical protein A3K09_00490 [Nitrospinae bacterium RIFCSPLOWO2_12_FULL_47_7]|nr:MAG: hypothetical protein A3K09_00490 [Nitrospinae bacterium RIFCSPLOWO2_12_FULL_47_7]